MALGAGAGLVPGLARAALPVPPSGRLAFAVLRKGSRLGTHVVTFEHSGDALAVHITVDLAYKFGPITLYRYHHRGSERWQNGELAAISSSTDDNGTPCHASGRREARGFVVEGSKAASYVAPAEALPANHWNRAQLGGPWINTQDGRLFHPRVASLGPDTIPLAGGGALRANHFRMSGDVQLDSWYEPTAQWAGLSFTAKDGSVVRYERLA